MAVYDRLVTAHDVAREIALDLRHFGERSLGLVRHRLRQLAVENGEQHLDRFGIARQLVQGPGVLVLRRLEKGRLVLKGKNGLVLGGGFVMALGGEQQFRAPEAAIRRVGAVGEVFGKRRQRGHRCIDPANILLRPRQLVVHPVIARVVGALLEQSLVQLDGFLEALLAVIAGVQLVELHLQISQAALRLGPRVFVRGELEQGAVVFQRQFRAGLSGHFPIAIGGRRRQARFPVLQAADGGATVACAATARRRRAAGWRVQQPGRAGSISWCVGGFVAQFAIIETGRPRSGASSRYFLRMSRCASRSSMAILRTASLCRRARASSACC